jgi:hypothetical protein
VIQVGLDRRFRELHRLLVLVAQDDLVGTRVVRLEVAGAPSQKNP